MHAHRHTYTHSQAHAQARTLTQAHTPQREQTALLKERPTACLPVDLTCRTLLAKTPPGGPGGYGTQFESHRFSLP